MIDIAVRCIFPAIAAVLLAASLARPAFAVELRNDAWTPDEAPMFIDDFDTGDIVAARLVPTRNCPCAITSISFLFGGGSTNASSLTVRIWGDADGALIPAAQRFSRSVEVQPDDDELFVLDLSADPVTVGGPFRVGIILEDDGFPALATDTDGTDHAGRNFVFEDGVWARSSTLGVEGDWIIRATIEGGTALPCATPVSGGEEPEVTDCLYILRTAVGQVGCDPTCICDPSGNGEVGASDALLCLKRAVGQDPAFECSCG
jgi:hypothetical protein